ncbi:MAG: lipoyl synthase [Elusimicrobia bacterium]|nr:lipoyl synthase [Elusimicrobiota bacterium]
MSECGCGAQRRLPEWFRQEIPDAVALGEMRTLLQETRLHTVCEGARCPNLGECWAERTATFMILGQSCSRGCHFCAVPHGTGAIVDDEEPLFVADAVHRLGLRYVVITSVTRDDLPDGGANHFARTVRALRQRIVGIGVELLIPDFQGDADLLRIVAEAEPDVVGHNIETVRRLSPVVRSGAEHDRSLSVLRTLRHQMKAGKVKSGLMVGMGETDQEVLATLRELREAGCEIVTIGQYLAPTRGARHVKVDRFVDPGTFEMYRREGERMGFSFIHSGPLVRSSYLAEQAFRACAGKET